MVPVSSSEFARMVRHAYRALPAHIHRRLENVDISVEDWPSAEDLDLLESPGTLFGLFTGVPATEREGVGPPLPDRIILFRGPILESCSTLEEVRHEVRVTLWHEVGHYLGMDEEALHRLGYG